MASNATFPLDLDNVWIYLRKSREDREAEERARREGREESETLSRHRRALLELAHTSRHNISPDHILEEVVSGEFISERPEMLRLIEAVDNDEVTAVWVMDLDRLGRGDMADQGAILRAFKDSETLILTPDKVYDLNDEMDEEWTEFKTFFARRELKMITKRMQRGRVASVNEGKFIGTRPPFGYDVNRDLVLMPNQDAPVVQSIFSLYANDGLGCNRIAHHLNSLAIMTPMGKQWRGESVIAILRNPVYAGYITWRKVKSDKRRGTYRKRPEDQWIRAKGKHDPLVDEVTFERTVQIRARRTHAPVRQDHKPSSPLSGLIQCGKCGEMMVKRPYSKQAAHLICKNPNCAQKSTRLSIVEERIIHALSEWLEEYKISVQEIASAMTTKRGRPIVSDRMLATLDEDIRRVDGQRDRLHDFLEQGVYDTATYLERNQKLLAELTQLRSRRQAIETEIRNARTAEQAKLEVIPRVSAVLEAYRMTNSIPDQNGLLKSVLHRAKYNKEKWQQRDQFELTLHPLI